MPNLRGYVLTKIEEGVTEAGVPSTLTRLYNIVGNVDEATMEAYQSLVVARVSMQTGREDFYVLANGAVTGAGVVTAGVSALRLSTTNSQAAKGFYATSILFASGAAVSGGFAVMTRMCKISEVAVLSEVMGGAFLYLGETAHAAALKAEGKDIPLHLREKLKRKPFSRPFGYSDRNLSFVTPCSFTGIPSMRLSQVIEIIPFEKIGKVVGVGLSVYGYYKVVTTGYHYGQILISKYNARRIKKKLYVCANFLITNFDSKIAELDRKRLTIYRFAISLPPTKRLLLN